MRSCSSQALPQSIYNLTKDTHLLSSTVNSRSICLVFFTYSALSIQLTRGRLGSVRRRFLGSLAIAPWRPFVVPGISISSISISIPFAVAISIPFVTVSIVSMSSAIVPVGFTSTASIFSIPISIVMMIFVASTVSSRYIVCSHPLVY